MATKSASIRLTLEEWQELDYAAKLQGRRASSTCCLPSLSCNRAVTTQAAVWGGVTRRVAPPCSLVFAPQGG